ncbi:MAG: hypothetical protein ACT4O6_17310 [Reyranella sp.]
MTPEEALESLETFGGQSSVPQIWRTAARQRASFRYHLRICGSVAEAAARAGVNRGSLYRWRTLLPNFAKLWDEAIAHHAREVGDDIVLQAGQRRRINTRLLIHVQKRMDGERHRAEDRAERRELALLKARPIGEVALAERLFSMMEKRLENGHLATPAAPPVNRDSTSGDNGLAAAV